MNEITIDAKEKFNKIEIKNNSVVIFDVDDTALSNYKISKRLDFGYDIIGTIDDQWTNVNGPCSGIRIKFPNYLYEVK